MPTLNVYAPRDGSFLAATVLPGSGIVGTPKPEGRVLVDYEGRAYGQANLITPTDKVHHAADRHLTRYPTVARQTAHGSELDLIGVWDHAARTLSVSDAEAYERWFGEPFVDPADHDENAEFSRRID